MIQKDISGCIALIDNYDSFTYNIYQMVSDILKENLNRDVRVFRNDEISIAELESIAPSHLIISPGPGTPKDAGISVEAVRFFANKIPILGICLGMQCIAEAFGGQIVRAKAIVHGKMEPISLDGRGVFRNLPNPCKFTRYHSLAIDPSSVPQELEITARSNDGEIMGLRHKERPIEGVQFHPESIGSEYGESLLANFLHWKREPLDKSMLLNKVIAGSDLLEDEAASFMDELTDGGLDDTFTAGMLGAMAAKGYSAQELVGCVSVLIKKRRPVQLDSKTILDTCGTGGDEKNSFNISSFAALIAVSCGASVAKHGNRSVSSKSGSTDFYSALGIAVNLDAKGVADSFNAQNFAYMAAPLFHGAMKHAAPVRRVLGIKTIMNCLGPLANPARADYQLIGVYDDALLAIMAQAAKQLGVKGVMCVHSEDGLDEISPAAPSRIFCIDEKNTKTDFVFDPASLGLKGYSLDDLIGGDASENARIAREMLRGEGPAAIQDAVCLNAGAALALVHIADDIPAGYKMAKAALKSGKAAAKVEAIRKWAGKNKMP